MKKKKEAEELKKIFILFFSKRKEMLKNTSFKVEDVFGDIISKDNFSQEQITKLNNFLVNRVLLLEKIFSN